MKFSFLFLFERLGTSIPAKVLITEASVNIIISCYLNYFQYNLRSRTANFQVLADFSQDYNNLLFFQPNFDDFLVLQFRHFLKQ